MYRVIDVPGIFDRLGERDFGGLTRTLKLTVDDSFFPENAGSILCHFEGGHVWRMDGGAHDVEVRLDIAEFSSPLAGTMNFQSVSIATAWPRFPKSTSKRSTASLAVGQKTMCTISLWETVELAGRAPTPGSGGWGAASADSTKSICGVPEA